MKSNLSTYRRFKRFLIVNLGNFIIAAGLHFFLAPDNLAAGGSSGLAILIATIFPNLSISVILFLINFILFAVGLATIGKVFGAYTIYSTFAMSFFLGILERFIPITNPITDDIFINLFFGILIQAIGVGFVINEGASTGGTDIIGKIIEKYSHMSFGFGLAISDGLITIGALILYGPKIAMYSLFGVFVNSLIVDRILAGFGSKFSLTVSSDCLDEINDFIIVKLYRGSTIYEAIGGYSNEQRKVLTTVVDRKDYIKLRNFINKIDPSAFIYVSQVSEVSGLGFTFD